MPPTVPRSRPRGRAVSGLGHHCAVRAGQAPGRAGDQGEERLRLQRGAEGPADLVQSVHLAAAKLQPLVVLGELAAEPVLGQEAVDGEVQVLDLPGLFDVAVQARVVDRVDGRVEAGLAGEEDLHDLGPRLVHALQEAVALQPGHDLVADDQLHLVAGGEDLVHEGQGFLGRLRALHAVGRPEPARQLAESWSSTACSSSTHTMCGPRPRLRLDSGIGVATGLRGARPERGAAGLDRPRSASVALDDLGDAEPEPGAPLPGPWW